MLRNGNRMNQLLWAITDELTTAILKHQSMNSAHEAYAVILEELEEFWEEVKKKRENRSPDRMRMELIQIAAMACRTVIDLNLDSKAQPTD